MGELKCLWQDISKRCSFTARRSLHMVMLLIHHLTLVGGHEQGNWPILVFAEMESARYTPLLQLDLTLQGYKNLERLRVYCTNRRERENCQEHFIFFLSLFPSQMLHESFILYMIQVQSSLLSTHSSHFTLKLLTGGRKTLIKILS